MPYELHTTTSFERAFKKLPGSVQTFVKDQVFVLETDPLSGQPLKQSFRHLRSLHMKHNNIHYRVVYRVNDVAKVVVLHYVATRENFYAEVRRLQLKKGRSV